MELLFIGLLVGTCITYVTFTVFNKAKKRATVHTQSTILMEKIRTVCKLITVEGDFAEIYHYESVKEKFFKLLRGKKKALILVDAKAHVGFDLSEIRLESDIKKKCIILSRFPQPKLLSIETDFKYYDKTEGWLNPMTSSDLTEINKEAKQYIIDKVPKSGLIEAAGKELLTVISLMETLAASIGWTLDYSSLKISDTSITKKMLD